MVCRPFAPVVLCLAVVCLLAARGVSAAAWDPVDQKALALTAPLVDRNADAEVVLWDVSVTDSIVGGEFHTVFEHYLRIKIFTDRGRDQQSRIDIPFDGRTRIRDVAGRTVRRDGTTVELKREDIFQRDLVRASGLRIKATSFVLPGVETGGLIEYRWQEFFDKFGSHNLRLPFSRDIPVHLVQYHIQPLDLSGTTFTMKAMPFHASPTPLEREGPRRWVTSLSNVPAFPDEPDAPSRWELRPWMLIYYDDRMKADSPAAFWQQFSRDLYKEGQKHTQPSGDIRRAARDLVPATASVDEKIAAALTFVRTRIKRVDVDTASEAEFAGFKPNETPTQALKRGIGLAEDVRGLFAAVVRALDLDARIVALPDRYDVTFDPRTVLPQLLDQRIVAIRDGAAWRFVDPTNTYSPDGHLIWRQEGLAVLIPDDKALITERTPAPPPDFTTRRRTATLQLAEDGTLEGDVTTEYSGHWDVGLKESDDHLSPDERGKSLVDLLTSRLPGAEVTNVEVLNVTDSTKPYMTRYRLKVPGYAQRTGSRLFLQPAVFQKGVEPRYTASQRTLPLFFDYAWQEIDEITIALPPGYELETPDVPGPVDLGVVGRHRVTVKRATDDSRLQFSRQFSFGGGERLSFEASDYPTIKGFYDAVGKADGHVLTLRKAATAGPAQP